MLIDIVKGSNDWLTQRYVDWSFAFDDVDKPSSLLDQLEWLQKAGFDAIDVPWKQYKLACIVAQKTQTQTSPH